MNVKSFLERIYDVPEDYEMSLSHFVLMNEGDSLAGIIDAPIIGITIDDENKEIHFVLREDSKEALGYLQLPFEELKGEKE